MLLVKHTQREREITLILFLNIILTILDKCLYITVYYQRNLKH